MYRQTSSRVFDKYVPIWYFWVTIVIIDDYVYRFDWFYFFFFILEPIKRKLLISYRRRVFGENRIDVSFKNVLFLAASVDIPLVNAPNVFVTCLLGWYSIVRANLCAHHEKVRIMAVERKIRAWSNTLRAPLFNLFNILLWVSIEKVRLFLLINWKSWRYFFSLFVYIIRCTFPNYKLIWHNR